MMNFDEMLRTYNANKASTAYILGFEKDGFVYYVFTRELRSDLLKLGRTSTERGAVNQIRVKVNSWFKAAMLGNRKAILLGRKNLLDSKGYNKGEMFEKAIFEHFGKVWHKDNTPFNVRGDIELNGEQVQIKFHDAELTNETVLASVVG